MARLPTKHYIHFADGRKRELVKIVKHYTNNEHSHTTYSWIRHPDDTEFGEITGVTEEPWRNK